MEHLLKFTRRSFSSPQDGPVRPVPDGLLHKCAACHAIVSTREWQDNAKVCPRCGHHDRLAAREWVDFLLDPGSWQEHDADLASGDPLAFVSPKENYAEKLDALHSSLGQLDAAICGSGTIDGRPLALCVSEFAFMAGSMGSVVGEKIARSAERAAALGMPLLTVNASGGARMHEGMFALMQMAKVAVALAALGDSRQPHISLLTDPCYGGVTAAHASAADVVIAEPGSRIGFAGPRVIEQTIRQKLPAGFQTAEFLLDHGMVDMVMPRQELRALIGRILQVYG